MKLCPNCQVSISDTAKFCNRCGFNVRKYEIENSKLFCENCGTKIPIDSAFCPECGIAVEEAVTLDASKEFDFDAISSLSNLVNEQVYIQNGLMVENGVLTGYTGKKRNVTIYGSIEEIYDKVFENNEVISNIELQEGVFLNALADKFNFLK